LATTLPFIFSSGDQSMSGSATVAFGARSEPVMKSAPSGALSKAGTISLSGRGLRGR
jgi:hypothetical protein